MGFGFDKIGYARSARRKERILFVGGGALLFSLLLIAAVLTIHSQLVQAREGIVAEPAVTNEVALGTVVLIAANTKIPKGAKLTANYLREVHWPRDQVPEGAVRNFQDVENMFATSALPENQPILRSALATTPPTFSLGELLPPGHRAVTIQVNATSGVEGWATPGVHVDVFLTYLDPADGVNKTRVAVENAVVLSFGGSAKTADSTDSLERSSAAMDTTTVTLAVPFADSLKIQTAISMGRITLALRNNNDLASPGLGVFGANEWEQRPRVRVEEKKAVQLSKGFARITDADGNEKEFVLGNDDKWQTDTGGDEEY